MKSSKSQKHITIITDRAAQHDSLTIRQLNQGSLTTANRTNISPISRSRVPSTCKNKTQLKQNNSSQIKYISNSKGKKSRSNSVCSSKQSGLPCNQQNRKKQLDIYCFQRMLNQLKKYLIQHGEMWDFNNLCYKQIIKILWIFRFIPYCIEQQFIKNNQQAQLKKVYCLWLSLSSKKLINFTLLIRFSLIIQNISMQTDKEQEIINAFYQEVKSFNLKPYQILSNQDPQYTFFMKKMDIKKSQSQLFLDENSKQKIITYYNSFKLSKLRDNGLFQYVKVQEDHPLVSKKSVQLAEQKRKKIQQKIKKTKPHIQNINLLDLLSFRQRDYKQAFKKPKQKQKETKLKNKSQIDLRKRKQLKREIENLSRPKVYFDERRQDEVHYQRQQQQFTFHPRINPYRNDGKQKILEIRNVDKVLVRMKQARELKQEKKSKIQKGWSNNKKIDQSKNKTLKVLEQNKQNIRNYDQIIQTPLLNHQERIRQQKIDESKSKKYEVSKDYLRIPILYIDVNIEEGKKQRIIIYDNDKASDLAKQFGAKHKLPQETISRLEMLLQQQMETVLARIEEQTDDQCSIIY